MRFTNRSLLAAGAAAIGAHAISSGCGTSVAGLALGDLGTCLQITSLIPIIGGSGDITSSLNTYLSTLCSSSTPTCSNATLTSAQSTIASACASDLSAGGTDGVEVEALQAVLQNYQYIQPAACSKNTTTNAYCVTQTLQTVTNTTGQSVDVSFLTSLLGSSGNATSILEQALGTGQLCNGCVQEFYYQADKANSSISTSTIGQAVSSQCGPSFASTSPSGVSTSSTNSTTSSAAASTSAGAAPLTFAMPSSGALAGLLGTVGAVVAGGALVL